MEASRSIFRNSTLIVYLDNEMEKFTEGKFDFWEPRISPRPSSSSYISPIRFQLSSFPGIIDGASESRVFWFAPDPAARRKKENRIKVNRRSWLATLPVSCLSAKTCCWRPPPARFAALCAPSIHPPVPFSSGESKNSGKRRKRHTGQNARSSCVERRRKGRAGKKE